jgi:hypothetical protein
LVCRALYSLSFSISSTRYAKHLYNICPYCSNIALEYTLLACRSISRLCCLITSAIFRVSCFFGVHSPSRHRQILLLHLTRFVLFPHSSHQRPGQIADVLLHEQVHGQPLGMYVFSRLFALSLLCVLVIFAQKTPFK